MGKGKGYHRHKFIYNLARWPVALITRLKFGYTYEMAPDIKGPYIVLCNHTTNWDPMLVGLGFRQYMYFVASEHIFRMGWISRLLNWIVAPIARAKGMTDSGAAMQILRTIKRGHNVCIFPEGNMNWNGVTGKLHPTTAKIVKASRASLITYHISGGYLSSPRWFILLRKGKMHGNPVNVYTPEQIKAMSEDELMRAIENDIHEDAYETQRREMVEYKGKCLAHCLESAIYVCPKCGAVCKMHSEDSRFFCECGFNVIYNTYGFFENAENDVPFQTVYEWDMWQEKKLREMDFGDGPIYYDVNQTLLRVNPDHTTEIITRGDMQMWPDRFIIGEFETPISDISQFAIHSRETIVFSVKGVNYEVYTPHYRNGRKYMTMYEILTERAEKLKATETAPEATENE